ncbi:spore coat protein U domain-containing protein [Desulfotignum phosphitoxidans]|uniref:Spore coat protein U-like protein n=1 Tax=Desulfotignum phosphitoxidans DSM 13687 TaxID=1286635 RepID=S0G7Y8_9BACT|nr:spore coat protein U domain-containing protein [Desulfotignum phosphitoxidans]EMS81582.1 spore coat protein U-like protein [Desulfotignum phosphitoxidans DSM 13687]
MTPRRQMARSPRRHAWLLACAMAMSIFFLQWRPVMVWAGAATDDSLAGDLAQVQCSLVSASLNFGRLNLRQPSRIVGEGEVVVVCLNPSTAVRHTELALAFPTMGRQTALLRAGQSTLAAAFYRDAQFTEPWGDDRNGARALRVILELGPGERRRLRLPVHALLQNRRDASAGVYHTLIPITLTTRNTP